MHMQAVIDIIRLAVQQSITHTCHVYDSLVSVHVLASAYMGPTGLLPVGESSKTLSLLSVPSNSQQSVKHEQSEDNNH